MIDAEHLEWPKATDLVGLPGAKLVKQAKQNECWIEFRQVKIKAIDGLQKGKVNQVSLPRLRL